MLFHRWKQKPSPITVRELRTYKIETISPAHLLQKLLPHKRSRTMSMDVEEEGLNKRDIGMKQKIRKQSGIGGQPLLPTVVDRLKRT
ncbi:hypothetical protein V6N12_051044 [Hibiscus sabdariffa]|uniref:Uncharacterized protein n=1 Tax=Hibiscus sabdariffa TaxID=183260 RepID=A0ABR2GEB7_9ROSI